MFSWNRVECLGLDRKRATVFDECLMYFLILSEEDDFIKFLVERIASDVLDDGREALVLRHRFEVNGIVGREILVFWFYAWGKIP